VTGWPATRSAAAPRAAHGPVPGPPAGPQLDHLPADALRLATEGGARCLGSDDVGRLEPGYRADLVVWPGDDLADVLDPLAGLVLGPERHARHVLVGGRHVVRDGRLLGADMDALRRDLARRARRLWPEDAR
jgi:cytosine/adenosine deaminase-related metal-dependent hydrolase